MKQKEENLFFQKKLSREKKGNSKKNKKTERTYENVT